MNKKRKIKDVIRGILGPGFEGTQEEIRVAIVKQGHDVTQSTISRVLKQLGAIRSNKKGKLTYSIPKQKGSFDYGGSLKDLIIQTDSNESLIIVKTTPGSAMFVAGFLDHDRPGGILGTVAGDDTIFIAPSSIKKIKEALKNIKSFLGT